MTLRQRKAGTAAPSPDPTPAERKDGGATTEGRNDPPADPEERPPPSWSEALTAAAVMGLAFGMAFYKSHVYEPSSVRGQFLFRRFVMLKVFFGAMGTGALVFAAMASTPQFEGVRRLWRPVAESRGWLTGPALGGFLLGAGMATSGACPGMAVVALGAGTEGSWYAVLGGILGALVFGLSAEGIEGALLRRGPRGPTDEVYADGATGVPYRKLAAGLAAVCALGCAVLESLVPWKSEVSDRFGDAIGAPICDFGASTFSYIECPAWPPSLAGALVGLLQFPALLFIENILGSSTAYQVCASALAAPRADDDGRGYMRAFATPNPKAWWQVVYVALAAYEAYLCARDSEDLGGAVGVAPPAAFIGGFLMIFGSRLGGGCTSGHGLSGCAIMMIQSWIAVPAMFAGGIIVSVLWQMTVGDFFRP